MTRKIEKADREKALESLRGVLKSGDTVLTILRHCSRSGMSRRIDLYKIVQYPARVPIVDKKTGKETGKYKNKGLEAPRLQYLSGWAAAAMGYASWPENGIRINGCGMDMGFALVDQLRAAVFGWEKTEHGTRAKGELRQEWI